MSVVEVAFEPLVEAIVNRLDPVPQRGADGADRQIPATNEVYQRAPEAFLELVDSVEGVALVQLIGWGDAPQVVMREAAFLGPLHGLPLQEVGGLEVALLPRRDAQHVYALAAEG